MRVLGYITILGIMSLFGCIESQKTFSKIPDGKWRGTLYLNPSSIFTGLDKDDITIGENTQDQLPFNFEVKYSDNDDFEIVIINGSERIIAKDILFGRDPSTAKDTIRIDFPEFDTYISGVYEEKVIEGFWHVPYKENYKVKFKAVHGDTIRFKKGNEAPSINIGGKWEVMFEPGTDGAYPGIGNFYQQEDYLEGTFMTETGDFRFLEGTVVGNKAFLSCFDGAHAFLFEMKDLGDGRLNGVFKSGISYTAPFTASKNEKASLADPLSLTQNVVDKMAFEFKNTEGKFISLEDEKYQGKPKIIEIMGTWCPNCMDASNFLKEVKKSEMGDGVEIISIAFERYKDEDKNLAQLKRYKEKSKTPWEILLGGYYNKNEAAKALPQLDKILSYPTLVFLDKDNNIVNIYTGFSGPATDEFANFKQSFKDILARIKSSEVK